MANTIKLNKFDLLFEKIPKDPEMWNQEDVVEWLKLIGMEQYKENFAEMKIDGLIILELDDSELLEELKIATKLHRKKILKAIELLIQYHAYLKEDPYIQNASPVDEKAPSRPSKPRNDRNISNDELTKAQDSKRGNANGGVGLGAGGLHIGNDSAAFSSNEQEPGLFSRPPAIRYPAQNFDHSHGMMEEMPLYGNEGGFPGHAPQSGANHAHAHALGSNANFMNAQMNNPDLTAHGGQIARSGQLAQNFFANYHYAGGNGNPPNFGAYMPSNEQFNGPQTPNHQQSMQFGQMTQMDAVAFGHSQLIEVQPSEKAFIIINSLEGPNDLNHTIFESGAKIGRHSSNQIVIYDESVSRQHAEISFNPESAEFYLRDIGSTTGTFLKIIDSQELKLDMIIEIGSYQLMVTEIMVRPQAAASDADDNANGSYIEFTIYESPEDTQDRNFRLTSGSSIGRKGTNALCFSDDLHMSNLHCKVNLVGQRFIFEDMASTNGSWLRLSKEGTESRFVALKHETVFKIGNSAMYEVNVPQKPRVVNDSSTISHNQEKGASRQEGLMCTICWDAERDCLIMPCKHNVTCTRCVKSVKNCPICRAQIVDILKIYKA